MRRGFTLVEVLFVVIMLGVVGAITLPKLTGMRERTQLSGATSQFARAVSMARQAAIHRGKQSYFRHADGKVWVIVDTTNTLADSIIVMEPVDLHEKFGVSIARPEGAASIQFDPRGVSTQASRRVFQFVASSGKTDSLCVSKLGNTIRAACP